MAARSTSRFKQKPAVPFGDFMLPILGVIALGIVVVGIRILWSPSLPKPAIIAQPRSVRKAAEVKTAEVKAAAEPRAEKAADSAEEGTVSKKETLRDVQIAQPVHRNAGRQAEEKRSVTERPSQGSASAVAQKDPPASSKSASRAEQKKQEPVREAEKKPAVRGMTIDSSAYVVQCGSYTTRAAANAVVSSLKKTGHSAVVRKAEVNGKTYFRVIVAGGADRAQANEVAGVIKAAGHPVFVRQND